jgi:hypothetical protein
MEVYDEKLMKLANSLHHKTIDSLLTIIFRSGLQPYLHVGIVGMKRETLQQHKEAILVCEERIFYIKTINNMSIPYNGKIILVQKPQIVLEKIGMYCLNCQKTNHNVETRRIKRKEYPVPVLSWVIIQQIKI